MAEDFFDQVRNWCLQLPGAAVSFPFGPDTEVFKVVGKIFAFSRLLNGKPMVVLKALPEEIPQLIRQYQPHITPGWHVNKKHWITVYDGIAAATLTELITDSYIAVVAKLPKKNQPVNPHTFITDLANDTF